MKKVASIAENILQVNGNFADCLGALRKEGARMISLRDEAFARIDIAGEGNSNIGKTQGTWTSAGVEYAPDQRPILNLGSRLNTLNMARAVVEANKNGSYLSTPSTREYEQSLERAQKDESKDPQDRRYILLPSRDNFRMSGEENSEVLQATLRDKAIEYLGLNGKPINFYLVNKAIVDAQKGTILTPLWFGCLDDDSDFVGSDRYAYGGNGRARGVKNVVLARDHMKQVSERKVEVYTPLQVKRALAELGFLGLEKMLLEKLKR